MRTETLVLLTLLGWGTAGQTQATPSPASRVLQCTEATKSKSGDGQAYRGTVTNEDYGFSAKIPEGLTAWGGVALEAPFHGFTIFLNSQGSACILFEVHIRVDQEDILHRPASATPIRLGKATAWQSVLSGHVATGGLTNVRTSFSFKQLDQVDDGEVLLIAPTSELTGAKRVYDAFIQSLRFGARHTTSVPSAPTPSGATSSRSTAKSGT